MLWRKAKFGVQSVGVGVNTGNGGAGAFESASASAVTVTIVAAATAIHDARKAIPRNRRAALCRNVGPKEIEGQLRELVGDFNLRHVPNILEEVQPCVW